MNTTSHLRRKSKALQVSMTPPMPSRARTSSESSFDESYFSKTYVPLSSLPTPPLSSHSNVSSRLQCPDVLFSAGEVLDPELLGPAIHLTNLIPSSTSLTNASVRLVHAILTQANLPLETIALAVCILDSLNARFALQWRKGCPLMAQSLPPPFGSTGDKFGEQHIDSIHPELIILSALILAVKFLDDAQQTTKEYATDWGRGIWSCQQINFAQRCLLENLGYRILPLWDHDIILEALKDMEKAGQQFSSPEYEDHKAWEEESSFGLFLERKQGMSNDGKAVLGLGDQLTPVETPVENIKPMMEVSKEARHTFWDSTRNYGSFQLPDRTAERRDVEPFPVYVDPGVRAMTFGF